MPYGVFEEDGKQCVYKLNADDSKGEKIACHDTEDEANAQIAALNIAENQKSIYIGDAIKSLGDSRIGGYLVRWGSPDEKDLQGEYFTEETDLVLDWYKERPMLYHHGLDPDLQVKSVGTIDVIKTDDIGVWAEGQLDNHNKYIEAIKKLIAKGILSWSSGAPPHLVETANDGRIKRWPIIEGSLTPTPAEPRPEMSIHTIKSYKHYLETWLEGENLGQDVRDDDNKATKQQEIGGVEMTREEIIELIKQVVAEMMGEVKQAETEELPEEEEETMKQAMEDEAEQVIEEVQAALEVIDEQLDEVKAKRAVISATSRIVGKAYEVRYSKEAEQRQQSQATILAAKQAAMSKIPGKRAQDIAGAGGQAPFVAKFKSSRYDNLSPADMSYMYELFRSHAKANNYMRWQPDASFYKALVDKCGDSGYDHTKLTNNAIKGLYNLAAIKADELDYSTQVGFGDEWVPELWANEVWQRARLDNVMFANLRSIEMPSNPYKHPTENADPTAYFVPETTDEAQLTISGSGNAMPDSKIGTADITFTAKKHAVRVGWSEELREDGIERLVPAFREQAMRKMEDTLDNTLINGDTAAANNINLDGGTPAVTATYKAYDAIIKEALLANSGARAVDMGGIAPTLAKIREARFKLSPGNNKPDDLMIVTHMEVYAKLLGLDEFITMDKAGNLATAQTGQLGFIDGIPVFNSAEIALADTDGKITNGGNVTDTGRLVIVHKPSWWIGWRRRITQSLTFIPYYDSWQLVNTMRSDLQARVKGDLTDKNCAILYNIGV